MYMGDYNGRDVDEMSQKELLEYASEAFIFSATAILHDKCPFALEEFMQDYNRVVRAVDKRIQLHIDNDYRDVEYFCWLTLRNRIENVKFAIEGFEKEERSYYDSFVKSSPDRDLFLRPLSSRKQIEWLKEEVRQKAVFVEFAVRNFPFHRQEQLHKWQEKYAYYRAINDLELFDSDDYLYNNTVLTLVDELYSLYRQATEGTFSYKVYAHPTAADYDKILELKPCKGSLLPYKEFSVNQNSPESALADDFFCLNAEFLVGNKAWPSVKIYIQKLAQVLFTADKVIDVQELDERYSMRNEKGCIIVGGKFYHYLVKDISTPLQSDRYQHKQIFITPASKCSPSVEIQYLSDLFSSQKEIELLPSLFCDFANMRINKRQDEINPNKTILVISVIQAIQKGYFTSGKVYATEDLKRLFMDNWSKYAQSCTQYKPMFEDSFYRMKVEEYWSLIKQNGEADEDKMRSKAFSAEEFSQLYDHAEISRWHWIAMSTPELGDLIADMMLVNMGSSNVRFSEPLGAILKRDKESRKSSSVPVTSRKPDANVQLAPYPIPESTKSIPARAYQCRDDIEELIIPKGVKEIGNLAFAGCRNIRSVELPQSLLSIGNGAFKNCTSLRLIEMPSKLKSIGISAFAGCKALVDIKFSDSIRDINMRAFYGCSSLKSVVLPSRARSTGDNAFEACTGLESLIIPEGVGQISTQSFYGCSSLRRVTIPASVCWVGDKPFGETALAEITFAEGNDTCYLNPYKGIPTLKVVNIPASCSYISTPFVLSSIKPEVIQIAEANEKYVFHDGVLYDNSSRTLVYCRKDVEMLRVEPGTRRLGSYSLSGCEKLHTLHLPGSITAIEDHVFSKCKKLKAVYVNTEKIRRMVSINLVSECTIIINK